MTKKIALILATLLASHAFAETATAPSSDASLVSAERALMESLALESAPAPKKKAITAPVAVVSKIKPAKVKSTKDVQPVVASENSEEVTPLIAEEIKAEKIDNKELGTLRDENNQLKSDLEDLRAQLAVLNSQLDSARSELVVAETEVNRLSAMQGQRVPIKNTGFSQPQRPQIDRAMVAPSTMIQTSDTSPPQRGAPYPVATVSVESADLRIGPGISHPRLTTLPQGARIAVEMRKGEWYRVFSPSGERAWIHSGSVIFGDKVSPLNDSSAARVKGYKSGAEDRAFRELVGR